MSQGIGWSGLGWSGLGWEKTYRENNIDLSWNDYYQKNPTLDLVEIDHPSP
jgi:hypothetical protein